MKDSNSRCIGNLQGWGQEWTALEILEPRLLLTTYAVPDTIDYTGVTDVTAAIQSYLNSVPDGTQQSPNTIVFHQNGNYHIEGTLEVSGRTGLIINGNGALFNADRQLIDDNNSDDTFAGTDGDAWNTHWAWDGLATTRIISANTGKITPTSAPVDWTYGLAKIKNTSNTDADLTCTFRADTTQAKFGLFGRRAEIDNDTYYYCNVEAGQNYIKIMKVVDGVETQVATATGATVNANTNYTVSFQCLKDIGHTDLRAKYFATGGTDPGWLIDTTDSESRLQTIDYAAKTGMWFAFKGAGSTYVDDFFVNGDANEGTRSQWGIDSSSSYITLENVNIDGAYPEGAPYYSNREGQHGVDIGSKAHDILVDNVHATHVYGDGFYANGWAHDLTVQNSYFEWMGRQGLSVCNNYNVLVYNNYVGNATRSLFDIEPYGDNWFVDNLRIIGNTTGAAGNGWVTLHDDIGSLYVANNTANGPYGGEFFKATGDGITGYRGPIVAINNTLTAAGNYNNFTSVDLNGTVILGNQVTYPAGTNGTAVEISGVTGAGAVVGNNRFANITDSVYVSNIIKDVITWDNTTASGAWSSSTTVTELSDSYYFTSPYSDATIQNGSVVAILRKLVGSTAVTYNNLTTTGQMALVLLDGNGSVVSGYVIGGTATYKGSALPTLAVAPTILTQPASRNVTAGSTVSFSVVGTGSNPLTYQWLKNGAVIADATASAYSFTSAAGDNGAQFTCVVTNKYGSVTTSAATLTISAAATPTITANPVAVSVATGYAATFTVAASGPGPLTYQWQKNGSNITGATAATYVTPLSVLGDNGATFQCVVTNASGSTTSAAATLTVANVTVAETWTGTDGAAWPSQWQVSAPTGVTVAIKTNTGQVKYGTAGGTAVCTLDPAGSSFDALIDSVQQVSVYCANGTASLSGGLIARCADSNPTNFYEARMENISGTGQVLAIYRNGTQVATTAGGAWNLSAWYKMKFSVQSLDAITTELKVKIWLTTDNEPANWNLTFDDVNGPLQNVPGRVGIRSTVCSSSLRYWQFDDYSLTPTASGTGPAGATNLTVTPLSGSHVRLAWQDNSGNEDGFVVQRSSDGTTFTDLVNLPRNTTSYTDTSLSANTRYYYRVRTYNSAGFGTDTSTVRITTIDAVAGAISETWTGANGDAWAEKWTFEGNTSQVAAKDIQSNAGRLLCNSSASGGVIAYLNTCQAEGIDQTIKFNIDGNGGGLGLVGRRADANVDSYYYATATAGSDQILFYKVVKGTTTQLAAIKASMVTAGTNYELRFLCQTNGSATDLKAKLWLATDSEPGSWSAAISDAEPLLQGISGRFGLRYELSNSRTTTVDDYSATFTATSSSVTGLTATAASATQMNLSWADNSGIETGYRIQRSADGRTGWTTVTTLAAGTTSYSDTGLMPSTRYYYRVVAINAGGVDANQAVVNTATADVSGDVRDSFVSADFLSLPSKWSLAGNTAQATIDLYKSQIRVQSAGTASGNVLAFVNNSNAQDTNQVGTFTASSNSGGFGLLSRRADSASTTYYYCLASGSSDKVFVYKVVAGVTTQLGTATLTSNVACNIPYKMRFLTQQNGATTDLKVKIWQAGTAEPGTWNITVTGNSEATLQNVSGRSGGVFGLFDRRDMTMDDYICSSSAYLNAPAAPTGLGATTASPTQINLSWTDASNNESYFVIERSPDGSTAWTQIAAVPPGTTGYSDTALAASTTYYYRVKSSNGTGDSAYTSNASATTLIAIPAAPTALSASVIAYNQINLAWTDNASNETGYKIERSSDGGATWSQIDSIAANSTSYNDTTVSQLTTYHYRVRASNSSGDSAYSNIVNGTTPQGALAVSETWTGSNGAAWPSQWVLTNPSNEAVTIQSNSGEVKYSTAANTVVAALDPTGTTYDAVIDSVQQVSVYCSSGTASMEGGLVARRADSNPSVYYRTDMEVASGTRTLRILRGSTVVATLGTGYFWNITTWYNLKFSVQTINSTTTQLQAKLWLTTDPEPATWTLTYTDTATTLQGVAGRVGIHARVVSSPLRYWRFDDYSGTLNVVAGQGMRMQSAGQPAGDAVTTLASSQAVDTTVTTSDASASKTSKRAASAAIAPASLAVQSVPAASDLDLVDVLAQRPAASTSSVSASPAGSALPDVLDILSLQSPLLN